MITQGRASASSLSQIVRLDVVALGALVVVVVFRLARTGRVVRGNLRHKALLYDRSMRNKYPTNGEMGQSRHSPLEGMASTVMGYFPFNRIVVLP